MPDLEDRLRSAVNARTGAYQPSDDLSTRIGRRVRRRDRNQRLAVGGTIAALVLIAGLLSAVLAGDRDRGLETVDEPTPEVDAPSTTSTTAPVTTAAPPTTAETVTTTTTPASPALDSTTLLSASGVGPIRAGMTLLQAQEASGLAITPQDFEMFGGQCYLAGVEGQPDLSLLVVSPTDQPVEDPMDGVIGSISIYAQADPSMAPTARTTTAGVGLGATRSEVEAAHEEPVAVEPHFYIPDPDAAYLYVHPADEPEFGIRYVTDETGLVTSINVGDRGAIQLVEGCA